MTRMWRAAAAGAIGRLAGVGCAGGIPVLLRGCRRFAPLSPLVFRPLSGGLRRISEK
jgi:hypothetical protein